MGEAAGISSLLSSNDERKCSKKKKKAQLQMLVSMKKKSDALNQSAAGRGRRRVPSAAGLQGCGRELCGSHFLRCLWGFCVCARLGSPPTLVQAPAGSQRRPQGQVCGPRRPGSHIPAGPPERPAPPVSAALTSCAEETAQIKHENAHPSLPAAEAGGQAHRPRTVCVRLWPSAGCTVSSWKGPECHRTL